MHLNKMCIWLWLDIVFCKCQLGQVGQLCVFSVVTDFYVLPSVIEKWVFKSLTVIMGLSIANVILLVEEERLGKSMLFGIIMCTK